MSEENAKNECGCGCEHSEKEGGSCGCKRASEGEGSRCGCKNGGNEGEGCGCKHDGATGSNDEIDYSQFDVELPKPTLVMIATTLAQQAMVSMGILPNPATGKSVFLMRQASYLIDSIDLLFQKTEGNRTEDETRTISNMMSELRMLYVKASEEKNRREAAKKA